MSDALTLILNGLLQGDLDADGHKILNLDISNLGLGEFGPQEANTVFAGPASGDDAVPVFRVLTASEVGAQPANANLTEFATMNPTLVGANFITLTAPVDTGFVQVGDDLDNTITYRTPAQVLADIGAQPESTNLNNISLLGDPNADRILFWDDSAGGFVYLSLGSNLSITGTVLSAAGGAPPFSDASALVQGSGSSLKQFRIEVDGLSNGTRVMTPPDYDFTPASIDGAESLKNKNVNGLTIAVGTAPNAVDAPTYAMAPGQPFALRLVAIDPQTGTTGVIRTSAPFDVVMPVAGTLAIVAETIALASLDTDKDLGGALASDGKVASQRAGKFYTDAHTGAGVEEVSGATLASATSVDLSGTAARQITITGTTPIELFILDEGDEKVLVFEDALDLVAGEFLATKGGEDSPVKAGSYIIVRGKADAKVEVVHSQTATGYQDETFNNIFMEPGGNIGFANLLSPFFVLGDHKGDTGNYLRVTAGEYLKFVDKNNDGSISLDTSLLSNTERIQKFCDVDGIFGMYVPAPALSGDAGSDGQWSTDDAFLYAFNSGENKWGRVALSYAWP